MRLERSAPRWSQLARSRGSAALLIGIVVFAALLGLRACGRLQGLELQTYDSLVRFSATRAERSSDIVLVEVTEGDITRFGWPLSDFRLTDLLRGLFAQGAGVIGVDLYRNVSIPPGKYQLEQLLQSDLPIVVPYKFGGERDGVPGPPSLRGTERTGFNDLLVDPDGTVRRGLLFMDEGTGQVETSFTLRIASLALAREGIHPAPDPDVPEWLRLGATTFRPFEADDGGYSGADAAGYQFPLEFGRAVAGFDAFTLSESLRGGIPPTQIRGKIVLVGVDAESLHDEGRLPVQRRSPRGTFPGVELHALIVQQLLDHARGLSAPLRTLTNGQEAILLLVAVLLGSGLGLLLPQVGPPWGLWATVGAVLTGGAVLFGFGHAAFDRGVWIPVATPGLGWVGAIGLVTAWVSTRERSERGLLMKLFARHQSPRLAKEIWRRRDEFFTGEGRLVPARVTATVLFVDMKGYTSSAEKLDPSELMEWINAFMGPMARRIDEFGGYVDDYFGDGIKADFGVPIASTDAAGTARDARNAVECALAMAADLGSG